MIALPMHPALPVESPTGPIPPAAAEVRAHLGRVLASPAFRTSKRSCQFLEFIVGETLEGRSGTLKERTLATEVFDRSTSWDAGDDTIVRVGAREVRKRLAQFYAGDSDPPDNVRIDLPLGSYVPVLLRRGPPALPEGGPVVETAHPEPSKSGAHTELIAPERPALLHSMEPKRPRAGLLLPLWWGVAAVAVAVVCWRVLVYAPPQPAEVFWKPFFRSSEPIILAVAHPLVYAPSTHAYQLNSQRVGPPGVASMPLEVPLSALSGSDFVPQPNQYLAFGDAVAASEVQVLLAEHSHEAHLRFASKVEFADLREGPAVMIGAFSNRWTVEMTQNLRFHFGYDAHWVPAILDSQTPGRNWSITGKREDGSSPEDYFLICRLLTSPSGNPVIIGGGVAQFGTEAAGRFLRGTGRMNQVLRGLKTDWANHNLELVLHAHVIGNSPAAPDLVASYVW